MNVNFNLAEPRYSFSLRFRAALRSIGCQAIVQSGVLKALSLFRRERWRILTYHRVIAPLAHSVPLEPGMYVRPETFEQQMRFLSEHFTVLSVRELVSAVLGNHLIPKNTIAITFDDGWADNYQNAFPVLKKYKLPATFFLATKYIGTKRWFWTDKVFFLHEAFRRTSPQQPSLREATLSNDAKTILSELVDAQSGNIVLTPVETCSIIRERCLKNSDSVVDQILLAYSLQLPNERNFMTWEEIAEMHAAGFAFSCHSHNHHPSTQLSVSELEADYQLARSTLQSNGIADDKLFCYPGGYWSESSQTALTNKGVSACFLADVSTGMSMSGSDSLPLQQFSPPLFPRVNIHEDTTSSNANFACRIELPHIL